MKANKSSGSDDVLEPLLQQEQSRDDLNNVVAPPQGDWMSTLKNGKYTSSETHPNSGFSFSKITIHSVKNVINARKRILVLVIVLVFMCLFYTLLNQDSVQRIPVIHHSHVPGMKALKTVKVIATANPAQTSTVATTTLKQDNINALDRRPREGRSMHPSRSPTTSSLDTINTTNTPRVVNSTTTPKKQTTTSSNLSTIISTNATILPPQSGYLVWSDKCKIPNIDPYTPEMMKYFKREKYESCSTSKPLTRVFYNSSAQKYVLSINEDQVKHYGSSNQLDCCYQVVERKSEGPRADQDVSLGKCFSFRKPTLLPNTTDNIIVKCKYKNVHVYKNGHAMIPHRLEIQKRLDEWRKKVTHKPTSVLMIGIDSISRVNLIRAMPKTAQYLYDNEWFEMSGYNKMDDNTFPNLMAILTGYNYSSALHKCNPTKVGSLDKCPIIWKNFRELGYVTAYAEDESSISTFNYLKKGFEKPPVDYYLRPFIISAEKNLSIKTKSGLIFCLGYQHSADYIYDYAIELSTRYRDEPYFGLFWANTFSHNALSDCSSMDDKMVDYLKQFAKLNILEKAIVIFFSDHGMRFGPTRKFAAGHLEERLPFMFIWIPPDLKNSHPEIVNALSVNKNRLTCPYDIHMTLKHILELSGRVSDLPPAPDCPNCQTLLKPVPQSRSCAEVSIEDHWCTCNPYISVSKDSKIVKKMAYFTVQYINDFLTEYENGSLIEKCASLQLKEIQGAYRGIQSLEGPSNVTIESYRIVFITSPNNGLFEATIKYEVETGAMNITGTISRLDFYSHDSRCISDGAAKKYCSCSKGSHFHFGK